MHRALVIDSEVTLCAETYRSRELKLKNLERQLLLTQRVLGLRDASSHRIPTPSSPSLIRPTATTATDAHSLGLGHVAPKLAKRRATRYQA